MSKHNAATVGTALFLYGGANAKDAQTVSSVLKKVYAEAGVMESSNFQAFLNTATLSDLRTKLAADGSGWAPEVHAEMLRRLPANKTYLKDYPRFIRRFLKFSEDAGLLAGQQAQVLPEWEDFIAKSAVLIPQSKNERTNSPSPVLRRGFRFGRVGPVQRSVL